MAHKKTGRKINESIQRKEKVKLTGTMVPTWYLQLEPEIMEAIALKQEAEKRLAELHTTIHTMMVTDDVQTIETEFTQASRIKPSEYRKFNTERFKEEQQALYLEYSKVFSRSGSVSLKLLAPSNSEAI